MRLSLANLCLSLSLAVCCGFPVLAQEKAAREKSAQEKAVQEKAVQEKAVQKKAAQKKAAPTETTDPGPAPTAANVPYGPHPRNVLDFWKAEGEGPRPLLVYIHGGGWVQGDKQRKSDAYVPFLQKGISYAAINYRLSGDFPLPAPVHDAARAIQFLKSKAKEWNIRTDRIVLTGGSAGACTSMWLVFHDDLANPNSSDPVERESTRVAGAAVSAGQTSIDPKVIEPWLGPNVLKHRMINMAVGESTIEGALANYDKHKALYVEFSPINHVDGKDPPLWMSYGNNMTLPSQDSGHGIHHPVYGVKLKEKSDGCGHECYLSIPGVSKSEKYPTERDFLMGKLLAPDFNRLLRFSTVASGPVRMSIAYEHSVEVQCSVTQAFDLIDDLPRTPEWLGPCTKLENVSSKSGNSVGDKLKYSYKQGGQSGVMDGEIVTLDLDRRHVCRYYDKMFEVIVDLQVSSHGSGCRLTHLITMTPKTFFGRMMSPLIRMGLKKQTIDAMNNLKTLLEV